MVIAMIIETSKYSMTTFILVGDYEAPNAISNIIVAIGQPLIDHRVNGDIKRH